MTNDKHYKILKLSGENFKRMKAFEIDPDGTFQVVSGRNANGKSSVLDSIWAAAQWKQATKATPLPVNKDAEDNSGYIEMEIGEESEMRVADFIIRRTFKQTDEGKVTTSLKITDAKGDLKRSPQALIDGLIGDLSFDPLEFAEMKENKQCDKIANLVQAITGTNISQYDVEHKKAFEERSELNREKKRLGGVVETLTPATENDPTEEKSATLLIAEMRAAEENNKKFNRAKANVVAAAENVAKAEQKLKDEKEKLKAAEEVLDEAPEVIDTTDLEERISKVDEMNVRARNASQWHAAQKSLAELETSIEHCNARMELAKIEKREAIEAAELPLEGLEVTEDGVMLNDVPFIQASMAEKLKVSMAIAMAANPSLRVIRINDASLLDTHNFAVVREMAEKFDYQLWLEVVDDSGELGVYIEEGEVAN